MSDSKYAMAMQAADEHLGNLADDPETLYFLVKAARAANDQPRASRYARRMLRLSSLDRFYAWFQKLDLSPIATANAATSDSDPAATPTEGSISPYDLRKYQLAYDAFVGSGNLADAFRVAEAAVRQVPSVVMWHEKLAHVAEWYNKPVIALREWRWLSRHGGGEEALLAVFRLAPQLNDYDALLEAWKLRASTRRLSQEQLIAISDLFEQTDRQREGIKFFEARYNVDHDPMQLELAARLAERNGDDERANGFYFRLLKRHGFKAEWLLKIANLYLQKGEYQKAYDLLLQNRAKVDAKDAAYWKLMADLAWELQRDDEAMEDYRHLEAGDNLAKEDIARLIYLLGDSKPEEAAALAELSYRKFGDREMLFKALEIYAARHDVLAQRRLYESLAMGKDDLTDSAHFLMLRGQYLQESGAFQAARQDFRRAVAIAPGDASTTNALLWFLIDAHDQAALRSLIEQMKARGDQLNHAYWGALAAAYQLIDQPAQSVAYYSRQLKRNGQDFLWLVNYAEALEQNKQGGMAMRVRQYAWLQLRGKLHDKPVSLPFSPDMEAAARLAMMNQPDDPALALVRSVLRQDRLVNHDAATDTQTNELVLGWAASKEQSANAKAWLWKRYGMTLRRPLWGEAMVAMAENDTARLDRLLAEQADGMPMPERHDAALALEQTSRAQSIAFNGLTDNPASDEAHQRLTEDALGAASSVSFEMRNELLGTLYGTVRGTRIETPISRTMRLAAEFWQTNQAATTPSDFGDVPPAEKIGGLELKIHGSSGDTEIAVRRRNEYAKTTEARVTHSTDIGPRINLQLNAEVHAEATESTDMRVFGMRNEVDTTLNYAFSKREYVRIQPGYARYYTQTGDYLGIGKLLFWEVGHRVRTEYPDMKVHLMGSHIRFRDNGTPVLPLPEDENLYGLCLGFGETYLDAYTRAWRPNLDYCTTHNDVNGQGYNVGLGIAGSLAGHDQLTISLKQELGGTDVVDGLTRIWTVRYRYYFDRY